MLKEEERNEITQTGKGETKKPPNCTLRIEKEQKKKKKKICTANDEVYTNLSKKYYP